MVRAGLGQDEMAAALLREIEAYPGVRANPHFPTRLGEIVRTALRIDEADLAGRFVASYEPRTPYAEHALVAANAALTEAGGDVQAAAEAYADAAARWERFGVVPEQAFALLGEGRCLLDLDHAAEAALALRRASKIFERLRAAPALAETNTLLARADVLVR